VDKYAWATPDARAMRIIRHFLPIVEMATGRNGYWANTMAKAGIDVIAYDVDTDGGGTIAKTKTDADGTAAADNTSSHVVAIRQGGPECLKEHSDRALFLCYPDEDFYSLPEPSSSKENAHNAPQSLSSACLEHYSGNTVIHVGELYGDTLSQPQSPWGRSSGSEFQERLACEYHCLLKVALTNWVHVRDTLSVWKRSETSCIVFRADSDDEEGGEEEEEVEYKHVPEDERLPVDIAAPCVAHLLQNEPNDAKLSTGLECKKRKAS